MPTPSASPNPPRTPALAGLIAALLRRRSLALAGLALVLVVALLGLLRLRVDFSSTAFYGDDSAEARRFAEFLDRWGADDDTVLVLVHPIAGDDPVGVASPERLAVLAELADALAAADGVARVSSITALPPGWTARERTSLPFVPALLGVDDQATVIAVELGFSSDDVMRTKAAVDRLAPVLAAHDPALAAVGLTRELAGVPAIRASFFALVVHDQAIFVPLSLALIGLALALVFRRVHGVVIPAVAAAVPTLILVGVMAWLGEPIGLLNQAYFTLIPVILVADAIHLVARFHEELGVVEGSPDDWGPRDLDRKRRAIVRAGARVGLACVLTSVTTAVGFASLAAARMPILRGFGLFAALGIGLGLVVVLALVPLLLDFVDPDTRPVALPGLAPVDWMVGLATRRPGLVVAATLAALAAAWVPARSVEIDNRLTGLLDDDHPTSLASARIDRELGGVLGLEFELTAPPGVDLRDPTWLATAHDFERWLAAQPEVRSVEGLASLLAGAPALLGRPAALPGSRAEVDARMLALADRVPLERWVDGEGRHLRIHAGLPDAGGRGFLEFADRAELELQRRLAGTAVEAHATGTPRLAYAGVNRITHDLRTSFALVFVVVLVLIAALFRSPWPALAAILPNAVPLVLGYATVGLVGEPLDPLAAVILTLALGIAVDDTIHVLVRTREELDRGEELGAAIRDAVRHSGRVVAVTSVVIAGGLALNGLSAFPPLQMLGLLGAVVLTLALLTDVLLLPALLQLLGGRGLERR